MQDFYASKSLHAYGMCDNNASLYFTFGNSVWLSHASWAWQASKSKTT